MINKKELRIGNLVVLAHESNAPIVTIKEIGDDAVSFEEERSGFVYGYDLLLPIKLNSHWLQRCGLEDLAGNGLAYRMEINLADELCWYMQDGFMRFQSTGSGFTRAREHIKSVHQLQNFFYWHTEKELTIKSFNSTTNINDIQA